ncbi:hypothetical protein H8E77_40105 [bacterium]|nr:hypothetical protein [bacterium]
MKNFFGQFASRWCLIALLLVSFSSIAIADQVIYIDVAHYIPEDSQFGVEVKGNKWISVADPDAIGGKAFGGPGDSNYTADGGDPFLVAEPYLIIKFPVDVRAGESTADGKTWIPWARMRLPADQNSFYWQVSTDKTNWKPEIITNANRWNDDAQNGTNVWYWQDNVTGNDGGIPADMAVGVNYLRVGVRESNPDTHPLIDVACFRNDGGKPTYEDAIASGVPVEPAGKLAASWCAIKGQ